MEIQYFKNLFKSNSVDLAQLINNGAIIVDVRSKAEFNTGHVKGSVNIPLEQIGSSIDKLKSYNHVITCCRSGNRSAILGGTQITGTSSNMVYVPDLTITKFATPPTTTSDPVGDVGMITWDNTYLYVKTNTGWGRISLSYAF